MAKSHRHRGQGMAFTRFRWHRRYIPVCDAWVIVAEDTDTGVLWFPIRPVCGILRIDSPSQIEVIKGSWRLAPALHLIPIPTEQKEDGTWARAQQTQCLPYDEWAWWMGDINPRNATPPVREKLLMRQRALMDIAREIMRRDDASVEDIRQRVTGERTAGARETATGEIHSRCPVCNTPLCLVIEGVHLVAGVEAE